MTSYFEIGGHIIESMEYSNDIALLRKQQTYSSHREHAASNRESRKALTSLQSSRLGDGPDRTLFQHWVKTSFHPGREFLALPRQRQIGYLKNPMLFAVWGSGKIAEVIMMHDDYLSDWVDSKTDRFH